MSTNQKKNLPSKMEASAIFANDISFSYDNRRILHNISFSLEEGKFGVLAGDNGVGKSTLIRLILGELSASSGKIQVLGGLPTMQKQYFAYVRQKNDINSAFPANLREVVSVGLYRRLEFFKFIGKKYQQEIDHALHTVGLTPYSKNKIGELSGGQQQRAFIARALLSKPKLILLDEPTSGIDMHTTEALCCLLGRLNKENNLTVLMITHDWDSIRDHADKIFYLKCGGLLQTLSVNEYSNLINNPID